MELTKYSDAELIDISNSDIEKELTDRGYKYGWYKESQYAGVIYILVNSAFPNLVKIGYADDLDKRLKQLNSNSGLPDPFQVYAFYKVKKRLEDLKLHSLIDSLDSDLRHAKNREFYEMTAEKAYGILSAISQINGEEDLLVKVSSDNSTSSGQKDSAAPKQAVRKRSWTFSQYGIPIGAVLKFVRDETKTCTVVDEKHVSWKGETLSISKAAEYALEGYRNCPPYQGTLYFTYNGKTLVEIRDEIEHKNLSTN